MIVTEIQFFSQILEIRSTLIVLLPQRSAEDRQKPQKKFPVLTLLHGYTDDHTAWTHWTSIERYAEPYNLAVVMPAVHNSFYTDMVHGGKYFTFVTEEVPAVTRDIFPLSAAREDNFVAGLSMGGYGAFKLGLSCPEKYAAAASLSGAVDMRGAVKVHDDPDNPAWLEKMRTIFGDLDQFPGSRHDLFALAEKVSRQEVRPRLFQYCGTEDFLYADNVRFRDFIRPLGFDYTYEETPGDHTWPYWDTMIQKVLAWLPVEMKKLTFLTRTSLLLFFLFGLDKVLAFLRSMIVTRQFQLSAAFDAFNSANNLPDLLYALISGGTLAMALIPVLSETLAQKDRRALWDVFSRVANIFFLAAVLLAAGVAIFAPSIVKSEIGIVPGFSAEQHTLVASLMRLNLIATLIFSISGLVMSGLQANQHFLFPALSPIFYNVGQIFGALVLAPTIPYSFGPVTLPAFGLGVHGLVYGVIIGAALHLAIQIPGLVKYQFHWTPSISLKDPTVRRVLWLVGPRLVTMAFIQATFIARDNLASRLPGAGAISALAIGWMIMQVPETLIGTAIGTALLPTLSEHAARSDWENFRLTIERAVRVLVALCLPVAAVLAAVMHPLVRLVFGLDEAGTTLVTWTVRVYLLALAGESVLEVAARAFYARQDALRPLAASFLNSLLFIGGGAAILLRKPEWGAPGIALLEMAFTLEAAFLLVWLNTLLPGRVRLGSSFWRGLLAAAVGGGVAYGLALWLPLSAALAAILALPVGAAAALPFIWPEVRLLFRL